MAHLVLRSKIILRNKFVAAKNAAVGAAAVGLLRATRHFDAVKTGDVFAKITRTIGPWWPEHRVAHANLVAAFPEKSPKEIDAILAGVWDNLGRIGAEFAHLDHIWKYDDATPDKNTVEFGPGTQERFAELKNDGKGALIFASHLGNWELPALAAATHGLDSAVLFRRPNIAAADRAIQSIRAVNMGEMIANTHDAPVRIAGMLERGIHIGMLVDQHFGRGVDVMFFGRKVKANPLLARLVRRVDCPIHGVRVVRLPDRRFRVDLTEQIEPARDASGEVDIQGTMQRVTSVVEGWVREYPEQWLWLHRRWR
ncbi:lipid A biosynthesis lauroyl acyltransferase [[Pseudomonas] carboxydohydrogena]|uniref:Lipid A biosynthesis lauroyl acyltransferase n=1 Tax=Afipia carboxydohydrogena TaxID=290 RepID=A0ABY8BPX0_AFICR|nr:lipid A biosynthesis lauroyl acyltransferase [[Pseudomonas] carboxydohydrogena]WEF50442.1 lipid A biosynthesis lauroyl acyltransferase [[Pseudomonas] carboxydohydrogena]